MCVTRGVINEVADEKGCSSVLFFEARKRQDLYLWMVSEHIRAQTGFSNGFRGGTPHQGLMPVQALSSPTGGLLELGRGPFSLPQRTRVIQGYSSSPSWHDAVELSCMGHIFEQDDCKGPRFRCAPWSPCAPVGLNSWGLIVGEYLLGVDFDEKPEKLTHMCVWYQVGLQ